MFHWTECGGITDLETGRDTLLGCVFPSGSVWSWVVYPDAGEGNGECATKDDAQAALLAAVASAGVEMPSCWRQKI